MYSEDCTMRKIFVFSILFFLLLVNTGLAKKYVNSPFLDQVERTPPLDAVGTIDNKISYKDVMIQVTWNPTPTGFNFKMTNLSAAPFSIIWEETYFNDSMNKYTIVHDGIKDIREMPPTTVAPGAEVSDFLYPAAFVRYIQGRYSDLRVKEIFNDKVKEKDVPNFSPSTFKATITLGVGEDRYSYVFYFKTELLEK